MQLDNFSSRETALLTRALTFVPPAEMDPAVLDAVHIVKTATFAEDCDQLVHYYAPLGLETRNSRPVFDTGRSGRHRILLNEGEISGLSFLHTLVADLVHLANLRRYAADHGNVYRFTQEQSIDHAWYEFFIWTRFQAMKIATRAHALVIWHEVNGEQPPVDGCYRFNRVNLASAGMTASLEHLRRADDLAVWRAELWDLLQELALYFGRLAFYQRDPRPADLDESFPEQVLKETVGLDNVLALYRVLLQADSYDLWCGQWDTIRATVLAMQEYGRRHYAAGD
ncbi:MAG: hypothetical protein RBT36_11430 [Desulfobulbus sp.]|jgi:hypothetical protein|nr:hypothetical protein [Desulfobulbus sp.]